MRLTGVHKRAGDRYYVCVTDTGMEVHVPAGGLRGIPWMVVDDLVLAKITDWHRGAAELLEAEKQRTETVIVDRDARDIEYTRSDGRTEVVTR